MKKIILNVFVMFRRAQVIEVNPTGKEAALIFVDLGNIRRVKCADLRIPRAFGDQVCMNYELSKYMLAQGSKYQKRASLKNDAAVLEKNSFQETFVLS